LVAPTSPTPNSPAVAPVDPSKVIFAGATPDNIISGSGTVVLTDVHHPNGNIYDQVLMTGPSVTVAADPGQVVRVSFLDINDDITQVEFAGSGMVSIDLDSATYSPPAPPVKYIQPGVNYVKGHATVHVQNAAADTFINIFSVGRANAVNQSLFPAGMTYDAMADIQLLRVDGSQLGAIYAGNVRFSSDSDATGIQAPATAVLHRVVVGDINASDAASPLLRLGDGSTLDQDGGAVLVAGGRLIQSNGAPLDISSATGNPLAHINAVAGTLSSGDPVPVGTISTQFTSLNSGNVTVNGATYSTHALLSPSFDTMLSESGLNRIDFGDDSLVFSGGNNGTYAMTLSEYVDGDFVSIRLTGNYSYSVSGAHQNVMNLTVTFGYITLSSGSASFSGTVQQLANESETPVPTRLTVGVQLDSSVSGTGSMTVDYTSGPPAVYSDYFDLDHDLNFGFF